MAGKARHLLQRRDDARDASHGLRPLDEREVERGDKGEQAEPDVGGRGAVRRADGRLLLEIVRREPAVFRRAEMQIIAEAPGSGLPEPGPVGGGEGALLARREAQRPERDRRKEPEQPRRASEDHGGEERQQQPQQHALPERADVRSEIPAALLGLRGGLPLQQPPVADEHAPEGGDDGAQTDPAFAGQQPEPQKTLHDGAADTREQAGVVPRPGLLGAAQSLLGQRAENPSRQRKQRRERRDDERVAGQQEARQDREERHRRQEAAAQAVE